MRTYLLDTNILIDFFKGKREAQELMIRITEDGRPAASILSISELRAGWNDEQAAQLIPKLYKLVAVQSITKEIAEYAGKVKRAYKEKGTQLALVDTLIAATAIINDYQLVTRNTKDFPMPELKLYTLEKAA